MHNNIDFDLYNIAEQSRDRVCINFYRTPTTDERQAGLWLEAAGHYWAGPLGHGLANWLRDRYLILFCVDGTGTYTHDGGEHTLAPGQILLGQPNIPLAFRCSEQQGWEIWWILFGGDLAQRLGSLAGFSRKNWRIEVGQSEELAQHFDRMMARLQAQPGLPGLTVSAMTYSLLAQIAEGNMRARIRESGLGRALDIKATSVEEMAAAAHLSKYHFIRRFKQVMGVTPWRYILRQRLDEAKRRLADPTLSVKEVAAQLDFNSPAYFSRWFRKESGLTPRQFRDELGV